MVNESAKSKRASGRIDGEEILVLSWNPRYYKKECFGRAGDDHQHQLQNKHNLVSYVSFGAERSTVLALIKHILDAKYSANWQRIIRKIRICVLCFYKQVKEIGWRQRK